MKRSGPGEATDGSAQEAAFQQKRLGTDARQLQPFGICCFRQLGTNELLLHR